MYRAVPLREQEEQTGDHRRLADQAGHAEFLVVEVKRRRIARERLAGAAIRLLEGPGPGVVGEQRQIVIIDADVDGGGQDAEVPARPFKVRLLEVKTSMAHVP